MRKGRRWPLLLAAVAVTASCSSEDAGDDASTTTAVGSEAIAAYLDEVRASPDAAALERFDDDALTAEGVAFCSALERSGNALDATFELQTDGHNFAGQTYVIAAARVHLCPDLPGAAPDGG